MPRPSVVDWRKRWGINWITQAHDQNPCDSCWIFSSVALIESMVRIEHAVWCIRSEGDVRRGLANLSPIFPGLTPGEPKCKQGAEVYQCLPWIEANGVADPDCFPWVTNEAPYNPTWDRSGRTVKIGHWTEIHDIEQQKIWIDTVGPLICFFHVFNDFQAYNGTFDIYHKLENPSNSKVGNHYLLIIGYDDYKKCWIVKNSWGPSWGKNGFGRIGYGECGIDDSYKYGLHGVNPDPWTKRNMHNGNIIETQDDKNHNYFEVVSKSGSKVRHWWKNTYISGSLWTSTVKFGNDIALHPSLTASTYNRNFEIIYLTDSNRLHHWFFDQSTHKWKDGGIFGPLDAAGSPGFIQSSQKVPGNFEIIVKTADGKLNHWWRDNGSPWNWHDGGKFGNNVSHFGPALVQGGYFEYLECVAALSNGQMQHFWRDDNNGSIWKEGPKFGHNVRSPPCMIIGQYGANSENQTGNCELCVAVGGRIQHWWRNNDNFGMCGQDKWRWCKKCEVLAYAGNPSAGTCVKGGLHDHKGSYNYTLLTDVGGKYGQNNWRRCKKCEVLAYAGNPSAGTCVKGGLHDHKGSLDYSLESIPRRVRQYNWRWCKKCEVLAYAGNPSAGTCVKGGLHDHKGISDYGLSHGKQPRWIQGSTFGNDIKAVVGLLESGIGFNLVVIALTVDSLLKQYWRDGDGWHDGGLIGSKSLRRALIRRRIDPPTNILPVAATFLLTPPVSISKLIKNLEAKDI